MWCFQKPGFDALLLAELQRQQQCSQFCDTLLMAEGVSVPAHSCILSAISPSISSALSSTPPPPAGQSRLLEFPPLGACTLLHLVRLLYSGEMAGEGEREKQEAISAAAKLGIHGLVEVTKRDRKSRREDGEGRRTEVGVQTETLMPAENEGIRGRWRREVRDGSTFLWRETLPDGENDAWTQTEEELQVNTALPPHPAVYFDTIDMAALQSLGQTDYYLLPPQMPYIPLSLDYPPDGNHTHQPSSAPVDSLQESTAAGHTSVAVSAPPYTSAPPSLPPFSSQVCQPADPESRFAGAAREVAAAEQCKQLEQFQGNIPGYINHFLNSDKEEGSRRGRARRRRGAGEGGARRAGTGERRARRPRGQRGGRGRAGWTQTVDVQEVGASRLPKSLLWRWGTRTSRTGQGGGAVGRKLYLKTREPVKSCRRRRGSSEARELSSGGDARGGGAGRTQRGWRNTTQQFNQDGLPAARTQKERANPTASISFSSPPVQFHNVHTLSASAPSLQPSPSPGLPPPAASYKSPAPPLLHTTPLPPNNHNCAPHSQPPLPTSSSSSNCFFASSGNTLPHKQQGFTAGVQEAESGFSSANSEAPVLQQQGDGELNEMLEHFLQSFEWHVESCTAREEAEAGGQSCTEDSQPYTVLSKYRKTKTQTTTPFTPPHPQSTRTPRPVRRAQITDPQRSDGAERQQRGSSSARVPRKPTEGAAGSGAASRLNKTRRRQRLFSLERKSVSVRKPVSSSDAKTEVFHDRGDKLLLQMPVVKLERSGPLPARVLLRGHSCSSLDVKVTNFPQPSTKASPDACCHHQLTSLSSVQKKSSSSSEKFPNDSSSGKTPGSWITKKYPIRSRIREAHVLDSVSFSPEPPLDKRPLSAGQPGRQRRRPRKNGQLLSVSDGGQQHMAPHVKDEQLDKDPETHEEEEVQPTKDAEGPMRKGKKRELQEEAASDDDTVPKRVCSEPTSESSEPTAASADLVSRPATDERDGKTVLREIELKETKESLMDDEAESSGDNNDVDGDADLSRSTTVGVKPSAESVSQRWTGSCEEEEDVDVTGGSSPVPEPVIIIWTESSEGEEVDVVGEKADFVSVTQGEFADRSYRTEMLLD